MVYVSSSPLPGPTPHEYMLGVDVPSNGELSLSEGGGVEIIADYGTEGADVLTVIDPPGPVTLTAPRGRPTTPSTTPSTP